MLLVATLIALLAMIKGCHPERWCAAIIAGDLLLDRAMLVIFGARSFLSFDLPRLLVDVIVFALFLGISLKANRVYPLSE